MVSTLDMSAEDVAKFPKTSRFFCRADPQPENSPSSAEVLGTRSIHMTHLNTNANFLPYNSPQAKAKVNYPVDLFHLLQKITVDDAREPATEQDIPAFEYGLHFANDPVLFAETVASIGKKYGAVKFRFSDSNENLFKSYFQINHDAFNFKTNRMLYNPKRNEVESRLRFYNELIRVHTLLSDSSATSKSPESSLAEKRSNTLLAQTNIHADLVEDAAPGPLDEKAQPADEKLSQVKIEPSLDEPSSLFGPEATAEAKETKSTKSKLPAFLMKLPMMDKRLLDLYDLFRFVMMKGGFDEVIQKKLWAQIGRELGYKGKITSSLSSSLKSSYAKILYPLEAELGHKKAALLVIDSTQHSGNTPSGKLSVPYSVSMRSHIVRHNSVMETTNATFQAGKPKCDVWNTEDGNPSQDEHVSKRRKLCDTPLALGSAKEFRRSIRLKSSKGFLLNEPHLLDVKSPLVLAVQNKSEGTKPDEITPTTASAQINAFLKWIANSMSALDDSTRLEVNGKLASVYTLRQFVEKDSKFQDFLVSNYPENFGPETRVAFTGESMKRLTVSQAESLYWKILSCDKDNGFMDGMKLENGCSLSNIISGSGFPRVGDDLSNFKYHLNNAGLQSNLSTSCTTQNDLKSKTLEEEAKSESPFLNSMPYISRCTGNSLSPFNLHNLLILPDSLLGAYNAADLNNRDLTNTSLNIGMTYSTENWRCEDHFTQVCNYLFLGASKRWFFIPELEFEKFERLVDEIVTEQEKNPETMRINKNYSKASWLLNKLMEVLGNSENSTNLEHDFLLNSLENMINPYPDWRTKNQDPSFQKLIDLQKKRRVQYNQEYVITPEMLTERGIEYTSTIQRPGEFIIKYPKTFSFTISFGFNLSEEVNFATRTWLDYAQEGEEWLKKQGILPNMLVFRLLINLAQSYESMSTESIPFSGAVYEKALEIYDKLLGKELALRAQIRDLCELKETVIEDRNALEAESVSDDDLLNVFPSKVVLTEVTSHQQFVMSIGGFIAYLNIFDANREEFPDFLNDPSYSVELQLFFSDEKLRFYQRVLSEYSVDFKDWMKEYDTIIHSGEIIPLKTYKSLLADGQKISVALTTGRETFNKFIYGSRENSEPAEQESLKEFRQVLNTLQTFVDDSANIIEECQSILALKHQQRIRSGGVEQSIQLHDYHSNGLDKLIELVDTIPKLIFHVPEFDQIFEFKTEIENFDRACRALIQKEQPSMSELSDMINLGTSFGLRIPSLEFLVRLRDRQKWLQTFDIIIAGGDPFVGRKEVFSLKELKQLRDEGLQVLAKNDVDKLMTIDQYVHVGEEYEISVKGYIAKNKTLDQVKITQLENLIEDMEERSKMKHESRLFVTLDTYHQLLDLKSQSKLIDFLQSYTSKTHKLYIVRQMINDLDECGYEYEGATLKADVQAAERWLKNVESILARIDTNIGSKSKKKLSSQHTRQACNSNIIKKLFDILNKCETSFAGDEADSFTASSPYLFLKNIEDGSDSVPMRYCLCREYEGGTMIECDKCHEWYHVACVAEKSDIGEDNDRYSCPECLMIEYYSTRPVYPVFEDKLLDLVLADLILKGEELRVQPSAEINMLRTIQGLVDRSREYFTEKLDFPPYLEHKQVYDMFLLRKFYGNPILVSGLFNRLLDLLKQVNFRLMMIPENEKFNVTILTKGNQEPQSTDAHENTLSQTQTSASNSSSSVTPVTSAEQVSPNEDLSAPLPDLTTNGPYTLYSRMQTGLGITSHLPIAFQRLAAFQNLALFQQSVFLMAKDTENGEAPNGSSAASGREENEKRS